MWDQVADCVQNTQGANEVSTTEELTGLRCRLLQVFQILQCILIMKE